jgi:opacity protein-like surface antigen
MSRSILFLTFLLAPLALGEMRPYLRAGAAIAESEDTHLRDRDCTSTAPPALFGCDAGLDGRPLGAYGDFGRSVVPSLAFGIESTERTRVELELARHDLDLDAAANFLGVAGEQPVRADVETWTLLVAAALDLAPSSWRVQPFLRAGAGAARHDLGNVTYSFPGIAADAVTITQGGTATAFAWEAGAGLAFRISEAISLDLGVRYAELGELRSDAGIATIVRPRGTFEIEIDETRARLKSRAALVALRMRL